MDPIRKRELKRQAWMRLAAQQRRAGLLRGRVVVVSLICFLVLWGIVFAQMATGNDPVLAGKEKGSAAGAVASTKREVETTDPRELQTERETARAQEVEEELFGPKLETEGETIEEEPEFAEEELVEEEPEFEEEEFIEEEPEFEEFVEEEPLVTSQS
jgi:non-ribosomal peptide synthetase component E (peptide arylation enzyme)